MVDKVLHSQIRHIEISWVDAAEILVPGRSGLVETTRIERWHVGIQTGHDLDNSESFLHTIGC